MKKLLLTLTGAALLTQSSPLVAQDRSATAAAIAERQDAAERYNRLSSQIDDLLAANADLQKKVARLAQELENVRAESARANANSNQYASREDLSQLSQSVKQTIKELDEKRVADNQKIVAALEEFKRLMKSAPPVPAPARETPRPPRELVNPAATESTDDNGTPRVGFTHTVAKGEYLLTIINAYNKELKEKGVKGKITLDSVLKANPGLDANRMVVGQKIFLPKPAE